jgi:hypothetical protein
MMEGGSEDSTYVKGQHEALLRDILKARASRARRRHQRFFNGSMTIGKGMTWRRR